MEMKSLKVKNKSYKIMVEMYDEYNDLKVSIIDEDKSEKYEMTIDCKQIIYPAKQTPDCVVINSEKFKDIVDEMLKLKILDYCNIIFAKFNMKKLYEYDKEGVKKFMDCHTKKLVYRKDIGKSLKEVNENIITDAKRVLQEKEIKDFLYKKCMVKDTNELIEFYTLINPKEYKDSVVFFCDVDGEFAILITPYYEDMIDRIEIVDVNRFSYKEGLFYFLQDGFEIKDMLKDAHISIWAEIDFWISTAIDSIDFFDGIVKYFKYCKTNKVNLKSACEEYIDTAKLYKKITN